MAPGLYGCPHLRSCILFMVKYADAYEFYAVSLPLRVAPVLYGCSRFVYMLSGTLFLYIVHGDILMTTCVDSPSYVIQNKVNKNLYWWPLAFMDVPICAPVYCSW